MASLRLSLPRVSSSLLLKACAYLWIFAVVAIDAFIMTSTTTITTSRRQRQASALGPIARNGLYYEDVEIGTGRRVNKGDTILCYYSGSYQKKGSGPFAQGTEKVVFDETEAGEPVEFLVGKGQLIPGMDIGIPGSIELDIPPMCIGGDRKLRVPSDLAYGAEGAGGGAIPPNQDLEFQIAVLSAETKGGVSLEYRLKGYAVVVVFATVLLSSAWFLFHSK